MIIVMLVSLLISLVSVIFVFLPVVTIATLPYVGPAISSTLVTVVGVWNAFLDTFPYAQIVWHVFLFIILPFEILMIVAKFFLGSRVPSNES